MKPRYTRFPTIVPLFSLTEGHLNSTLRSTFSRFPHPQVPVTKEKKFMDMLESFSSSERQVHVERPDTISVAELDTTSKSSLSSLPFTT